MSRSISLSYDLHPPSGTIAPNLNASKTQEFVVKSSADKGHKEYYEGLRGAIKEAKDVLGEELTAWRDAVGSREQYKEAKKVAKDEDEEAEDEEDSEEAE